ncbi:MAG TPA: hypothetical protein VFV87_02125 [Pirellulaceae bacterium]|nr:hypothetical protein [Pirellulaceae bacterium]
MRSMQFTSRDLIWITIAVALALGWAGDHRTQKWALKKASERAVHLMLENEQLRTQIERPK